MAYSKEIIDLSLYRLEKAKKDLEDAKKTLEFGMYDTSANRSYYAIFHAARAVLALDGLDYKKHSGVISRFQQDYIKTQIFDKNMSNIIKSAFDMRTESDYEDFYIISKEDVTIQVKEAETFVTTIDLYIKAKILM